MAVVSDWLLKPPRYIYFGHSFTSRVILKVSVHSFIMWCFPLESRAFLETNNQAVVQFRPPPQAQIILHFLHIRKYTCIHTLSFHFKAEQFSWFCSAIIIWACTTNQEERGSAYWRTLVGLLEMPTEGVSCYFPHSSGSSCRILCFPRAISGFRSCASPSGKAGFLLSHGVSVCWVFCLYSCVKNYCFCCKTFLSEASAGVQNLEILLGAGSWLCTSLRHGSASLVTIGVDTVSPRLLRVWPYSIEGIFL